jgi:predicted dehydrogenase
MDRRGFLSTLGVGSFGAVVAGEGLAAEAQKPGAEVLGDQGVRTTERPKGVWTPVSDRKIRVGIVGYGLCQFGAAFGFQDHPNVEIVAVSDLFPERCKGLAKACRCEKTYPSLEELVKDDRIEAVFLATDAPSHARHAIEVLGHGKHAACCVPAVWGSLEDAGKLLAAVESSGRKYMMFETSSFHEDCYAWRQAYRAGGFGKLVYTEGVYAHYMPTPLGSYKNWRTGSPPLWYPTHAMAYYVGVTGGSFTEVSCMAMPSIVGQWQPANNSYQNPFGTEIALLRTSEGGMARMACIFDAPGVGAESGTIWPQRKQAVAADQGRPPLPPKVRPGGHGGSHGNLMNEFVTAILEDRQPMVDVVAALNMTVPGVVAHQSATKGGELLKIPQYRRTKT